MSDFAIYSPQFHLALAHVLQAEGGYADNPKDPGGATFRGITLALLKRYRNGVPVTKIDLARLDMVEIYKIYHWAFWSPIAGDELPAGVSLAVFDAAVNSGPKNAILALQRSTNRFTPFALKEDGVNGPKTTSAANAVKSDLLLDEFGARRMLFYGALATFQFFGFGWARRLMKCVRLASIAIQAAKAALPQGETK